MTPLVHWAIGQNASTEFSDAAADLIDQLFPRDGDEAFVELSFGSGTLVQRGALAGGIAATAWFWAHTRFASPSREQIQQELRDALIRLRTLAAGGAVEVPHLIGLTGIAIKAGVEVALPWGRLRAPTPLTRRFWHDSGDAILEVERPVRLRVSPPGEATGGFAADTALPGPHDSRLATSLAVLVAQHERRCSATWAWESTLSPLHALGSSMSGRPATLIVGPTATLAEPDVAALEAAGSAVAAVPNIEPLRVAVERLTSAVLLRESSADGLIDALIALEAIAGDVRGGAAIVRAAVALLIEPERPAERSRREGELAKAYARRNSIVHGDTPNDYLNESRLTGIDAARDSLSALVRTRPELIATKRRGRAIILGLSP